LEEAAGSGVLPSDAMMPSTYQAEGYVEKSKQRTERERERLILFFVCLFVCFVIFHCVLIPQRIKRKVAEKNRSEKYHWDRERERERKCDIVFVFIFVFALL
jgi:hypothetical protein